MGSRPYSVLQVRDGLAGVQTLGAHLGAVHDGVAAEQLEGVIQEGQALRGLLVTGVLNPSISLSNRWGYKYMYTSARTGYRTIPASARRVRGTCQHST